MDTLKRQMRILTKFTLKGALDPWSVVFQCADPERGSRGGSVPRRDSPQLSLRGKPSNCGAHRGLSCHWEHPPSQLCRLDGGSQRQARTRGRKCLILRRGGRWRVFGLLICWPRVHLFPVPAAFACHGRAASLLTSKASPPLAVTRGCVGGGRRRERQARLQPLASWQRRMATENARISPMGIGLN